MSKSVCEWGFSAFKRVKTDWRNKLQLPMMNCLLHSVIGSPEFDKFDPEPSFTS